MYNFEQWNGFKGSIWKEEVNVENGGFSPDVPRMRAKECRFRG